MRTLSTKDTKYGFGHLISLVRAAPATASKYEWLKTLDRIEIISETEEWK